MAISVVHMVLPYLLATVIILHSSNLMVQGQQQGYISGDVASLFPFSNSGSLPPKVGRGVLPIYPRYGPCSPTGNKWTPNASEISHLDRLRFRAIRLALVNYNAPSSWLGNPNVDLTAGAILQPPMYTVKVGFGTPSVSEWLLLDTCSYLNWVKCQSYTPTCPPGSYFDPMGSTSYRHVGCTDTACAKLPEKADCSAGTSCSYGQRYMPGCTKGVLSRDTLTISANPSQDFIFGCALNTGATAGVAGVLALANHWYSSWNQLSKYYGVGFHYCLPVTSCHKGHLTFGGYNGGSTLGYTPLLNGGSPLYFVSLTGITVGGQLLPVNSADFSVPGTVVDSATAFTYLPKSAYAALRDAFQRGMSSYTLLPPVAGEVLDTCYDLTGVTTLVAPKVGLVFDGVEVEITFFGIFHAYSVGKVCLAFAEQRNGDVPFVVGYTQQKKLDVVFDLANKRVGFGAGTC